MKTNVWQQLSLFDGSAMGGETAPALTRQETEKTGDVTQECAPVAEVHESNIARRESFRALMEGEYKDLFTEYFQETFNRRFKEQKSMMEELERTRNVVNAAADRYGTKDAEALIAAIRTETEKNASADVQKAPPSHEKADDVAIEQSITAAIEAAVARAREETERAVTESIRARGLRPSESALTPGVSARFANGAARLSRADRAEMARRAAKGERIEF